MENRQPVIWVYHTETHTEGQRNISQQLAWVSPSVPSYHTSWRVESLSRSRSKNAADHAKPIRATLRRHPRRLVLTPGKRSAVFTYGRTSTCNFPLRFWVAPQTSFRYLPAPHRCSGWFLRCNRWRFSSVALLCAAGGWTPPNGFTGVFIWDQIAICLELWSLCKPDQLDADSVEVMADT